MTHRCTAVLLPISAAVRAGRNEYAETEYAALPVHDSFCQHRDARRGFFSYAHKAGRVPEYLGDVLPKLPQPKMVPRPAPDDAWVYALAMARRADVPRYRRVMCSWAAAARN